MQFSIKSGNPDKQKTGCVILGVFESKKLSPAASLFDEATDGLLSDILRRGDMNGGFGQTLIMHSPAGAACERVLLAGCGKESEFSPKRYCELNARAACVINESGARDAASYLPELEVKDRDSYWKVRQSVECTLHALYRTGKQKSRQKKESRPLKKMILALSDTDSPKEAETALKDGQAIAKGVSLARELGNLPANICTPGYLAKEARALGRKYKSVSVTVHDEAAMKKMGMGSLLSVARGSREPAKLISIKHSGGKKSDKPVVLVGKGVTFDSGGISIKPSAAMDEMKFDMCGAASVLGTLKTCAELDLPINVTGVIPATENLPDGNASKPGDIVTSMSGQTIEILNTDAEGRLILCDALTYCERFKPKVVVDIATLTGACVIALGGNAAGLLGNDDELVKDLLEAGQYSGDRAWQLPLWDDYQSQLDSNFADMANIGGREAGTITAACFLSRFTKDYKWAHLDIAGVAWKGGKEKGGTGRPVSLLSQYLLDQCR